MMIYQEETLRNTTLNDFHFDAASNDMNKTFLQEVKPENKKDIALIKILVVEDTEICQKVALSIFNQPTYFIDLAVTGKEALEKYQQGCDVILLDLGLPDISGIDICRLIRQEIGDTTTPIIAYSTLSNSLRKECFEAGFTEVLTKPCSFEQLHGVIQQLVS